MIDKCCGLSSTKAKFAETEDCYFKYSVQDLGIWISQTIWRGFAITRHATTRRSVISPNLALQASIRGFVRFTSGWIDFFFFIICWTPLGILYLQTTHKECWPTTERRFSESRQRYIMDPRRFAQPSSLPRFFWLKCSHSFYRPAS